jgi:hypothetical protein
MSIALLMVLSSPTVIIHYLRRLVGLDAKCPGLGLVELNPEPKIVPIEVTLESTHQSAASPQKG